MHDELIKYLQEAFTKELPGTSTHRKLIPPGRSLKPAPNTDSTKLSGVLVLLFPEGGLLHTCLIKRPGSMKHHPGQIGFPGGKLEKQDLSLKDTAMRETEEEVGIGKADYLLLGELSDLYVEVSSFSIKPFVAWAANKPNFAINKREVEELFCFPIEKFVIDEQIKETEIQTITGKLMVPYYPFKSELIWGATAMILAELLQLIRDFYNRQE